MAGNGTKGFSGNNGPELDAELNTPLSVAVDLKGNLYIADVSNNVVRKVDPSGTITTVAGGGDPSDLIGDGGLATQARLYSPGAVAVDSLGNLYIADYGGLQWIRKVTPDGKISTIAGGNGATQEDPTHFGGDGGPALKAKLNQPTGLAVDVAGNLYIADSNNQRIRKVTPEGIITTVAGTGPAGQGLGGYSADGETATHTQLNTPYGIAVDAAGNLFIADSGNHRVRKVDAATGIITTVAGGGAPPDFAGNQSATQAYLKDPYDVVVDAKGNLFISDAQDNRIRKVSPDGTISLVAGSTSRLPKTDYGDGQLAPQAQLSFPAGLALDANGNLLLADEGHDKIRKIFYVGSAGLVEGRPFPTPLSFGDLTGDGKVDLKDVTLALQGAVGAIQPTPEQLRAADLAPVDAATGVRGDGTLQINDVLQVLRLALGLITAGDLKPIIHVSINPTEAHLLTNQFERFQSETVGADPPGVLYSVNGVLGGNETLGTLDGSGKYTAPVAIPAGVESVQLTATSIADPSRTASATVYLQDTLAYNMRLVGHTPLDGTGRNADVWVHGNTAYVGSFLGNEDRGVRMVDISDPAHPQQIGRLPGPTKTTDVEDVAVMHIDTPAFQGDIAFAGLEFDQEGFDVWDVTLPQQPMLLTRIQIPGGVHNFFPFVREGRPYVATATVYPPFSLRSTGSDNDPLRNPGLRVYDMSDPRSPARSGELAMNSHDLSVSADGKKAFVADAFSGLSTFDLSDLSQFKPLGNLRLQPMAFGHTAVLAANEKEIVYGDEDLQLRVLPPNGTATGYMALLDVSDGSRPQELSRFTVQGSALSNRPGWFSMHNAVVDGNLAYLSWYSAGIVVVDISDPALPKKVGYFVPPAQPDPGGGSIFVSPSYGSMVIPTAPLVWGVYKHTDGYIYASDINGGLYILEYTGPKN